MGKFTGTVTEQVRQAEARIDEQENLISSKDTEIADLKSKLSAAEVEKTASAEALKAKDTEISNLKAEVVAEKEKATKAEAKFTALEAETPGKIATAAALKAGEILALSGRPAADAKPAEPKTESQPKVDASLPPRKRVEARYKDQIISKG